jgi:hypothetical protein
MPGRAARYGPVPVRSMAPRCKTEHDGFLQFTPTGAHSVLPRWSPAARSRNLAL